MSASCSSLLSYHHDFKYGVWIHLASQRRCQSQRWKLKLHTTTIDRSSCLRRVLGTKTSVLIGRACASACG